MKTLASGVILLLLAGIAVPAFGQSLGNAGTIAGGVVDPSGAAVVKATVTIHNAVTGYSQSTVTTSSGLEIPLTFRCRGADTEKPAGTVARLAMISSGPASA